MRANIDAKLITCFTYGKKDKNTKEKTGEIGIVLSLLVDENLNDSLSGKVIHPFIDEKYTGVVDFENFKRLDDVIVDIDIPTSPKGMFVLYNLKKKGE